MAEGGAVTLSETLALYHGDRKKLGLDFHEIGLVVDDGINVLVGTRGFLHIVLATDSVDDSLCIKRLHLCLHVERLGSSRA